jgi:hypothetical protein
MTKKRRGGLPPQGGIVRGRMALRPLPGGKDAANERILSMHRRQFENGNNEALLEAMAFCGRRRIVQPDWIVDAFAERWKKWTEFQVRTADEAFGLSRPKGQKLSWLRLQHKLKYEVLLDIADAQAHRRPVNHDLYEEIGERYGVSATTVDKLYREARKTAWVVFQELPECDLRNNAKNKKARYGG